LAVTYEPIAKVTLGSASNTITFSNISGSYTDLILQCRIVGVSNEGYSSGLKFNGDTGSNYSYNNLYGTGSSVAATKVSNNGIMYVLGVDQGLQNSVNFGTINIFNYSNSSIYKTVLTQWGQAENSTMINTGLWRSTSAITSIELSHYSNYTFSTGSIFTLYGILKA
jgi:hypothetical protein